MLAMLSLNGIFSLVFLLTPSPVENERAVVKYRHFEDYLKNLDSEEQAWITGDRDVEGSGEVESSENVGNIFSRPLPIRTGSVHNKEVTCCMLGQLAGDKGFHCFVKFYVARVMLRNQNRAHNRKMAFHGRDKVVDYGAKVMRTFEKCISGRGYIFHKCCRTAAMERHPLRYDSAKRNSLDYSSHNSTQRIWKEQQ